MQWWQVDSAAVQRLMGIPAYLVRPRSPGNRPAGPHTHQFLTVPAGGSGGGSWGIPGDPGGIRSFSNPGCHSPTLQNVGESTQGKGPLGGRGWPLYNIIKREKQGAAGRGAPGRARGGDVGPGDASRILPSGIVLEFYRTGLASRCQTCKIQAPARTMRGLTNVKMYFVPVC